MEISNEFQNSAEPVLQNKNATDFTDFNDVLKPLFLRIRDNP